MLIISGAYFKANTDKNFIYKFLNWDLEVFSNEAKPILRPLSDLKKKDSSGISFSVLIGEQDYMILTVGDPFEFNDIGSISLNCYRFLLSLHFDVFGLIEKGLAIDINKV